MLPMEIVCSRCNKKQKFLPRSLSDRPKKQCTHCNRYIYVDKKLVADYLKSKKKNDHLTTKSENSRPFAKSEIEINVLEYLSRDCYASHIARELKIPPRKVSTIIKWLIKNELITYIKDSYPKKYQTTQRGLAVLKFPNLSDKSLDQLESREKEKERLLKIDYSKVRVHKVRIKDVLIQRPSWLFGVSKKQRTNLRGLDIERKPMNNWECFIIRNLRQVFKGLSSIEVNVHKIIYNFKMDEKDQYVYAGESIEEYEQKLLNFAKDKIRPFLKQKDFTIDESIDPAFLVSRDYANKLNGKMSGLGSNLNVVTTDSDGNSVEIKVDDSLKDGEGEIETTSTTAAQDGLDLPKNVKELKTDMTEVKQAITEMSSNIKDMVNSISTMTSSIKELVSAINPNPPQKKEDPFDNSQSNFI